MVRSGLKQNLYVKKIFQIDSNEHIINKITITKYLTKVHNKWRLCIKTITSKILSNNNSINNIVLSQNCNKYLSKETKIINT